MGRLPWLWGPLSGGKTMFCILLKGGGSLRRMDFNSSQRGGGLQRFSPLPGFGVFLGPQETLGDTLCLLSWFALFGSRSQGALGPLAGDVPGGSPWDVAPGGLLEPPFAVFLVGWKKEKVRLLSPRPPDTSD